MPTVTSTKKENGAKRGGPFKVNTSNLQANVCDILSTPNYWVANANICLDYVLVDRGANGGITGSNVRIIRQSDWKVNVSGIDNHQLTTIVTAGGVIWTQ